MTTTARTPSFTGELRKALSDRTPLYAVAGAGDLAFEKLRTVPDRVAELRARVEPRTVTDDVQARVTALQREARDLPARATSAAIDLTARANDAYEDLAERGKRLVDRIGRQRAASETREHARDTVSGVRRAATTARTSAKRTRTATKGAATSARKTARSAAEAARAGAGEVGA